MRKLNNYQINKNLGIEFLIGLFDELILSFKNFHISTKDLQSLIKGKYIIENFDKVSFVGELEIKTKVELKGESHFHIITISPEGLLLSLDIISEDEKQDKIVEVIFYSEGKEKPILTFYKLESWREGFYSSLKSDLRFYIKDEIKELTDLDNSDSNLRTK